ncbi:hypothetical protein AMS68_003197 [Peltaster fructicola]|uniref:Amine oxidase domain-containing protein n=1 Tax=Peltaster fructicola TaxID=286661 RepID=A0A6H0XT98_9PEZI|nr:hypothetical protein AMS68_003197 [Peltaster fructicola]
MKLFAGRKPKIQANTAKQRIDGMAHSNRRKIAIVGSGVSGLACLWALKDTDYEVHIFEKSDRLGGHTNTRPFVSGEEVINVDTGFIVMNNATYPNFMRFLKAVGITPVETLMTFGVSRDHGAFEWSGETQGIFAQRRNLFRPSHWRLIFDIVRFNQFALDLLEGEDEDEDDVAVLHKPGRLSSNKYPREMSIGEYLDREGYSQSFRDDYLIPMTAAVWSTSPDKCSLDFPALTLVRFMWNHHLLTTIAARPPWLTIPGGSKRYIEAIIKQWPQDRLHVRTSCEVANILRPNSPKEGGVTVSWINAISGRIEGDAFDHVVMACHGDEVLPILNKHGASSPVTPTKKEAGKKSHTFSKASAGVQYVTQEEINIFSAFHTSENVCYLHSDLSLMPKRRATWTSWNYLTTSTPSKLSHPADVSLTYNMNILQHYSEEIYGPVLVTMNPDHPPEQALTQGKFYYRHPLYTAEAVHAQKQLERIQNKRGVSYAGAWTKYGFHEDGFSSGLRVAIEHLGARVPFEFVDSTYSRGHRPVLNWKDYLLRLVLSYILIWLRIGGFVLGLPIIRSIVPIVEAVATRTLNTAEMVGLIRDAA